jgi:glycerol transport system substrate-binding protein
VQWTPTGTNVPDYPKLAQLWWQNIGDASSGAKTAQEAMDALCAAQEEVLTRLQRAAGAGVLDAAYAPVMNEPEDAQAWFDRPGAPYPKLANEKPTPVTVDYDTLVKSWSN